MKEPNRIDLSEAEANKLLARLEGNRLEPGDYEMLGSVLNSWLWLSGVVQDAKISIQELKKLIFGAKTEKTRKVLKKKALKSTATKEKPKGHGRNGADAYPGAERICIKCLQVHAGDRCPECGKGKLYAYKPSEIVCIRGQAPLAGKIYVLERLRCNICGAWFKAPTPPEAAGPKYDAKTGSMLALLRYGVGVPHNRLAALQLNLGISLPSSTQWDVLHRIYNDFYPVFTELNSQAAQGELFHNDDTTGRVLTLEKQIAEEVEAWPGKGKKPRTGVFTTGIIAVVKATKIALFFTSRKHAGENLADLLKGRTNGLSPPIQMCDALSRNAPKDFKRLLANCLCHGRRNFVKIIEDFPEPCQHVLETLREVYKNDAITKKQGMSKEDRLAFHQKHSKPIMDEFFDWLTEQINQKKIEPNSRMGEAINYMINHWPALTLFLEIPGAPLDNNICERALKVSIRHRRNSLFYKTERGAQVGDMFMSLIHTCRLNNVNAFKYLAAIQEYAQQVEDSPADWMPWNYQKILTP